MWPLLLLGVIGGGPSGDEAVVCLQADTLPLCSGVLAAPTLVVTAGHCAYPLGRAVPYFIAFGPDCRHPTRRVPVTEMETHPQYAGEGQPFDLAVVRLKVAVTDVAPLVAGLAAPDPAAPLRHVGFGTSRESPMEGWGERRTVTHAATRLDPDFLWSGDAAANTCTGDSGGAALQPVDGREQLVALVSDGPDCHSASADQRLDVAAAWLAAQGVTPPPPPAPREGCATAPGLPALLLLWSFVSRRRAGRGREVSAARRCPARAPASSSGCPSTGPCCRH